MDEDAQKELADLLLADAVIHAVKHYGIEGCKEAIERVYPKGSVIQTKMLAMFKQLYEN